MLYTTLHRRLFTGSILVNYQRIIEIVLEADIALISELQYITLQNQSPRSEMLAAKSKESLKSCEISIEINIL